MLDMLEKQASQIKTAADQFRALMKDLDKLAFTPDPVRKVESMDALLAVRDYNSPVFKRHRDKPGAVDELLGEKPLNTVAEVGNLPSEAQVPPQPAEDGSDMRAVAKENKGEGTVGYTWDPSKLKTETVGDLVARRTPGTGGTAKPQPRTNGTKTASFSATVEKLAKTGQLRTLDGWQSKTAASQERYRPVTMWERLMRPEGLLGEVIPLDPKEREKAYRKATMFNLPASIVTGGLGGGMSGYGGWGTPKAALIGAGVGALSMGALGYGLRELMAKKIRDRAIQEQLLHDRSGGEE